MKLPHFKCALSRELVTKASYWYLVHVYPHKHVQAKAACLLRLPSVRMSNDRNDRVALAVHKVQLFVLTKC